jgi:O-antigen/teichoic acid export membrane protein
VNVSQRVLYNTVAQIAGKVALLVASLGTLRLATSYLGVDGFGEYAIVLSLAPILLVFADLGFSTLLARELAQSPERRDELAATLFPLRLAASAAVVLASLAVVPFLPYDFHVRAGLVIACVGVSLLSIGTFATPFFQVGLRLDLLALLDVGTAALNLGLVAAVTQLDLGFYALVGVSAVVGLANLAFAWMLVRPFWQPSLRFDRKLAKRLLADGLPLAAVIVLGLLHFRLDAVLLSLMRPSEDVGVYTVAFRFLEQSLVLPVVFMAAVFPLLAVAVRGGDAADVVRKAFNFLLLIALPLALGLAVLAGPLVAVFAGDGFEDAATPLRILAPALVFAFVSSVFSAVLIALNRQRALILASLGGLALNLALNLWAIPRFGYTGAAVTTVFSEAVGLCLVFALARRACDFRLSPRLVTRADVALLLGS